MYLSLGPWMLDGGRSVRQQSRNFECRGIHPYPLFFPTSEPLIPEVKYLLSLHMLLINKELEEAVAASTIWGFQGVPRIKTPMDKFGQDLQLRWKQVYRKGLSSSVSSGQFPVLYFIK